MRRKAALAGAILAACMPTLAHAECLGQGCYDGVVTFLIGAAVVVAALVITLVVLLVKRRFKAALILVGLCGLTFLVAAGSL